MQMVMDVIKVKSSKIEAPWLLRLRVVIAREAPLGRTRRLLRLRLPLGGSGNLIWVALLLFPRPLDDVNRRVFPGLVYALP